MILQTSQAKKKKVITWKNVAFSYNSEHLRFILKIKDFLGSPLAAQAEYVRTLPSNFLLAE